MDQVTRRDYVMAGRAIASVRWYKVDSSEWYVRLELWCKQAGELVIADFDQSKEGYALRQVSSDFLCRAVMHTGEFDGRYTVCVTHGEGSWDETVAKIQAREAEINGA